MEHINNISRLDRSIIAEIYEETTKQLISKLSERYNKRIKPIRALPRPAPAWSQDGS